MGVLEGSAQRSQAGVWLRRKPLSEGDITENKWGCLNSLPQAYNFFKTIFNLDLDFKLINKGGRWPSGYPTKWWHHARFRREQEEGPSPGTCRQGARDSREGAGAAAQEGPGRLHLPRVDTRGQPWLLIYGSAPANGDGKGRQSPEPRTEMRSLPLPRAKRQDPAGKKDAYPKGCSYQNTTPSCCGSTGDRTQDLLRVKQMC